MTTEPDILCERAGAAGVITLNRPKALNALNLAMVRAMTPALEAWATDSGVTRIIVKAAGDKAFCAGGDIRTLYEQGRSGRVAEAKTFWREEYRLNAMIARYPKPYVALIDGIVMGGGAGVSVHGSHRVGGDKYLFAMPEVGIGFFPDVGASYALPRLAAHAGTWLALTGDRIRVAEACALRLLDAHVASDRMASLYEALVKGGGVEAAIEEHATPAPAPKLDREAIEACFGADSVEEILTRLDAHAETSPFAAAAAATMRTKSPTSLKVALEQMRRGASMDFEAAMAMEFRIVSRIAEGHDFYEGVRAVIIDKDNAPLWAPATLDGVSREAIERHFDLLGADEWRS